MGFAFRSGSARDGPWKSRFPDRIYPKTRTSAAQSAEDSCEKAPRRPRAASSRKRQMARLQLQTVSSMYVDCERKQRVIGFIRGADCNYLSEPGVLGSPAVQGGAFQAGQGRHQQSVVAPLGARS